MIRPISQFAMVAGLMIAAMTLPVQTRAAEPAAGGETVTRRLSPDQYRQIVEDVFGSDIKLGGRFEPDIRMGGLLAVGAGHISVTATGLEQYDSMARTVATQVVDERHRDTLIPCKPAALVEPDDACAGQFLSKSGRLLYRRPLTPQELQVRVAAAAAAARTLQNFYSGLALSLAGMLESSQFLFRREVAEADPDHPGQYRLNAYSKASQLSFLLWNTAPDSELLTAAEHGDLGSEKGLARQVDRMLASPRLEAGVRAFFADMLQFDTFATLAKDPSFFPKFTSQVATDAQEQTLRTLTDLLVTHRGDYRDLFTTRKTFLTPALGAIYSVPVAKTTPNGAPDAWTPFEYPEGDPRSGIVSQVSFVALHSHPGRSSPTIRGKALRQTMLCQKVPDPPGNVNFAVVQDTTNPQYKTARERLTAHRTDPTCAGCHKLIDPIGFSLETFDSGGGFRTTENGVAIDPSGELDGTSFKDGLGLGKTRCTTAGDDVLRGQPGLFLCRRPAPRQKAKSRLGQVAGEGLRRRRLSAARFDAPHRHQRRLLSRRRAADRRTRHRRTPKLASQTDAAGEPEMIPMRTLNRRKMLRGMLGGAAVTLGVPFLDCFLNTNGTAQASGAPLPLRFGTWIQQLGMNPGFWEPTTVGPKYEMRDRSSRRLLRSRTRSTSIAA